MSAVRNIVFKYASDIHLELKERFNDESMDCHISNLWDFDASTENCDYYLALTGDIGNSLDNNLDLFLNKVSPKYSKIFYVMGNHEYYNKDSTEYSMDEMFDRVKTICQKYDNIVLLDNSSYDLETVKVIGTTLWSNIPDHSKSYIKRSIRDFSAIVYKYENDKKKPLTVEKYNSLNEAAIQFINEEIAQAEKPIIVLTHYAPLFNDDELGQYTADPMYSYSENSYAFHNDLAALIKRPIVLWIFGHTHYATEFSYNNVLIATNQLGYLWERDNINFDSNASININDLLLKKSV